MVAEAGMPFANPMRRIARVAKHVAECAHAARYSAADGVLLVDVKRLTAREERLSQRCAIRISVVPSKLEAVVDKG